MMFIVLLPTVYATSKECVGDFVRTNKTYEVAIPGNTTYINISKDSPCVNGCSETLNDCRPDDFIQVVYAFLIISGVIMFCSIGMYVSEKTDTMIYVATNTIATILMIMMIVTDVFNAAYRTIFLASAFIPLTFTVFAYFNARRGKLK